MSLKALSTPSMVSISSPWIDPARDRPLWESMGTTAGLLPRLDAAHARLVSTQPSTTPPAELAGLQRREAEVDALHDRKVRGIFNLLTGLADLADAPADTQALLDLRDHLFPDGLQTSKESYAAEAGNVELVEARLTAADTALLGRTPVFGGTLQAQVHAWKQAGKSLGELERQKAQLPVAVGTSRAEAAAARNGWITVVNALVANAALDPAFDDAKRLKLLGPVDRLSTSAQRRQPAGEPASDASGDAAPAAQGTPSGGH
jgi:hypothetical protein